MLRRPPITKATDVAIVGAGPYGLSIAAHLSRQKVDFQVFGKPMDTWRNHMPKDMLLKSDGFASSLSAPTVTGHTLAAYCADHKIPYDDVSIPVQLSTFVDYALDFQRRFVPTIDGRSVARLTARNGIFEMRFEDGDTVAARRVILAVGVTHFGYVPPVLAALPPHLLSHSSAHHTLDHFKNCDVIVVGAGSSAVDLAALLGDAGASVQLVARKPTIVFWSEPKPGGRTLWQRIRHPQSGLGPGLRSRLACDLPGAFSYLPSTLRLEILRRHLGPASAWHLKSRIIAKVSTSLGCTITGAKACNARVNLSLRHDNGTLKTIEADHAIAATGYQVDLERLSFLDNNLRSQIRQVGKTPILSRNFESSVPGLYFAGLAAASTFGPLMRFVYGADFAARRVSAHVTRRH